MTALVSRPEANLLIAARAVVHAGSRAEFEPLLLGAGRVPDTLSPAAMKHLTQTLSQGLVLWLARAGAAREFLGARLWARSSPLPLHFSPESMRLLQWLVSAPLSEGQVSPLRFGQALSPADELLLLGAVAAAMGTAAERNLCLQAPVRESALCALAFPAALARWAPLTTVTTPRVGEGQAHDFALEALQGALATWWQQGTRLMARSVVPADVAAMGRAQRLALKALTTAADVAGRRALLGFVLEATAQLLLEAPTAGQWVATFDDRLPLRERSEGRKAVGALLQTALALRAWDVEARAVRFIDDDYAEAQGRVKLWDDLFGEQRFRQTEGLLHELTALE